MKLLSGPLSMFGAKAEIAVAEKGVACEVTHVPFTLKTLYEPKHPDVVRINPKGQVPVLLDDGVEVFDSTQIFEYLETVCPDPALWPAAPAPRAEARLMELRSDEIFFPHVISLMGLVGDPKGAAALAEKAGIIAYYDEVEGQLATRSYMAGDTYSYADIAFIMAHYFAVFLGADLGPDHARLSSWRQRITARPAVNKVLTPMGAFLRSNGLTPPDFTV